MAGKLIAHTDGGSRGNPGPSAAAFILENVHKQTICAKSFFLGVATNNMAEYTAVKKALEAAKQYGAGDILVRSDSELLVKQINGEYKVKSANIKELFTGVMELLNGFDNWRVEHVNREKNAEADRLVNIAIDRETDIDFSGSKNAEAKKQSSLSQKGLPLRLGVLISGGGRTLLNILEKISEGRLNAKVVVVISSRSTAAGVERAEKAGLDVKIVRKKDYPDIDEFGLRLEEILTEAKVDLVVQAGWLCFWKIPKRFVNRVMNIHPALLPSFGGQGMWGRHVHEAVLKAGCKVSGCSVHFCTDEYDAGPIIVQQTCRVEEDDTADTLAARVFDEECIAYPKAIKLFTEGRLVVEEKRVRVLGLQS